jgi:hypothetical protein
LAWQIGKNLLDIVEQSAGVWRKEHDENGFEQRSGRELGAWRMGDDAAMLDIVSSANVACGFHAGDAAGFWPRSRPPRRAAWSWAHMWPTAIWPVSAAATWMWPAAIWWPT